MKLRLRFSLLCMAVLFAATAAFPREISTDFDHHADFSRFKTYSWSKVDTPNNLWDERVKEAIDQELSAKGWTQVENRADVAIVAIKTTQTEKTLQTFYDGLGGGWRWRGFGGFGESTTTEQDYKEGTLVVDMYDASTKQLIWRASAEDMLSDKAEKNEKNLDKGIAKMFKRFPPRSTKG